MLAAQGIRRYHNKTYNVQHTAFTVYCAMQPLLIGTSGYSYKDWVGPVYPAATSAKDYLAVYSRMFSFTELNFSYYRQPQRRTIERLCHSAADDFVFAVKAHQSLTHQVSDDFAASVAVFRDGIEPLVRSGKLCAVLLQFPYSFHYTPANRKYLASLSHAFEGLPLAVELRCDQWQRDSVYEGLQRSDIAYVNVDGPDLPGLPKQTSLSTAHLAYVRFHGRNGQNWWSGDNASRYDYLYTDDQLEPWVGRIQHLLQRSSVVIVAFNNHWNGQAVTNAKRLRQLLGMAGEASCSER
ncbi:MAG: DUF72 domain-containing protein [Chitinivibrionales bacterium]|nr:DUF72 domain-containing protein [Chitinivibrionales bacterium]